jgi:outer membrane protein TolC
MTSVSRRIVAFALAVPLALPGGLLAQQPAPQAQPAGERPVLQLSLDEAVKRAMENNLDIQVAQYDPKAADESIRLARGAYDPLASSTLSQRSQTIRATNIFAGAQEVTNDTDLWNFGVNQLFRTGGTVNVTFNNNKVESNSVFNTFNPNFQSTINGFLTQPLLRDLKIDSERNQLRVAKKNKEISDAQFRQIVTNVLATVKQQYYDLLAAIDNFEAQRKSLSLAEKLLGENRIKVRVGTLAPLDVVQAESEVATREENVIVAENSLAEAEDLLRRAIFQRQSPEMWNLRIVPTDRPAADAVQVNIEVAVQKALDQRIDIQNARRNLEISDYTYELAKNQSKPLLDLQAQYGGTGTGGTRRFVDQQGNVTAPPIIGGYNDALSEAFGLSLPTWSVGVTFSYPIFNRVGKANSARAQLSRDQARTSLARLEMSIAAEVRSAGRAVETNWKRVESTRAARVLSAQRLDAEEKKFNAGMTTNFFVTSAQRDLAFAEVTELRAIADYRKSLVTFERVQEAGLGGGGGGITVTVR